MTLTLRPDQVTESERTEALIREARRLQRRRWRRGAALVTLVLVVAAVVVTSLQGGGPPGRVQLLICPARRRHKEG